MEPWLLYLSRVPGPFFSAFVSIFPTKTATTLVLIYANGGYVSISGARIVFDDPVSSRSSTEMEPIHFI
jgi:hypothetical protein